jgi:ABC-2 type transport system ATP-binding protein
VSVLVENLTVRYGDLVAVDNVSFEAPTGSVTVILGPNGAGKTSTIEVCEGFRTGQGHVRVLGLDPVKQHQELTNRMGVMLQGGGVYASARVKDVIKHFCALHSKGVNPTDLIELVGLSARSKSTWRRLSGGEQQRLSLALALAAKPEVIFLDEPTSGVDIDGRDVIRDIILGLSQEGTTVLLASHDMAEAEKVATHAVFFKEGKILASGDIESLASARKRLRFTSTPGLVTAELAVAVKSPVTVISEGLYEVASEATPQLMTRISQWLADNQHPLLGVDMGTENLEETYRRFTRSTE